VAAGARHVLLEGVCAQPLGVLRIPAARALLPAGHDVGPVGAEQLIAARPKEIEQGLVGGEQHGVGRDHAERLQVRKVAEHLDEPADLRANFVRHPPGVLESRSHPHLYRPEGVDA
jgi:hypothetical protein